MDEFIHERRQLPPLAASAAVASNIGVEARPRRHLPSPALARAHAQFKSHANFTSFDADAERRAVFQALITSSPSAPVFGVVVGGSSGASSSSSSSSCSTSSTGNRRLPVPGRLPSYRSLDPPSASDGVGGGVGSIFGGVHYMAPKTSLSLSPSPVLCYGRRPDSPKYGGPSASVSASVSPVMCGYAGVPAAASAPPPTTATLGHRRGDSPKLSAPFPSAPFPSASASLGRRGDSPKLSAARKLPAPPLASSALKSSRRILPRPLSCDVPPPTPPDLGVLVASGGGGGQRFLPRPVSFDHSDDAETLRRRLSAATLTMAAAAAAAAAVAPTLQSADAGAARRARFQQMRFGAAGGGGGSGSGSGGAVFSASWSTSSASSASLCTGPGPGILDDERRSRSRFTLKPALLSTR